VPSAGNHLTDNCGVWTRENTLLLPSAGNHAAGAKRGKTRVNQVTITLFTDNFTIQSNAEQLQFLPEIA